MEIFVLMKKKYLFKKMYTSLFLGVMLIVYIDEKWK